MEDIDYGALLRHLKEKYADTVVWYTSKPSRAQMPVGKICVQTRVDQETFRAYARCLTKRRHGYVPLQEIEDVIQDQLTRGVVVTKQEINEIGRRLLAANKARWEWARNNYIMVTIPPIGMLGEWKGWLKFGTEEPRRRKWKAESLEHLFSTGQYAWFVQLEENLARLYYMGAGKTVTYASAWFNNKLLHAELVKHTAHADLYKWRSRELAEMRTSPKVVKEVATFDLARLQKEAAEVDAERAKLEAERAEWVAAKLAEYAEEEAAQKVESKNEWCGDISKRYVEDEETGGVIQKGHIIG
jgi:hypothetical protein